MSSSFPLTPIQIIFSSALKKSSPVHECEWAAPFGSSQDRPLLAKAVG